MNTSDIRARMLHVGVAARAASRIVARARTSTRDAALMAIAAAIRRDAGSLKAVNAEDVDAARDAGMAAAMLDRLTLSDAAIEAMAAGLEAVVALPDPIGAISEMRERPSGIRVGRMRVPLGVVGIIYESRPNVTVDAAGLTIKSGNAAILRGGSEAIRCNRALARLIHEGLAAAGLPGDVVQVVDSTDRAAVGAMITMPEYIDVIVPRGGKGLIERLMRESRVPMIKHLDGLCHVYVDDAADLDMAVRIADNAKTQRYGTCNTMETLLVARAIAGRFLPRIGRIYADKQVEIRADDEAREILAAASISAVPATAADFDTEWLAPVVSIAIVDGIDAAMDHIDEHGSKHTDTIVTEDTDRAMRFLREVDSASVMINASTRFADGFEFGLGAEIGISNDKLHARGPVGLEGLTSLKYVVFGSGEVRGEAADSTDGNAESSKDGPIVNTPASTGQPSAKSLRVLLVEDSEEVRETTVEFINEVGYEVVAVETAEAALDALAGSAFDIIFTDVSLPGMNGIDLLKRARQANPQQRAVIASGYGADLNRHGLGAGVAVLGKPYDLATLERTLAKVLDEKVDPSTA